MLGNRASGRPRPDLEAEWLPLFSSFSQALAYQTHLTFELESHGGKVKAPSDQEGDSSLFNTY